MVKQKMRSSLDTEKPADYLHFLILPLQIVGCWDWFPKPKTGYQTFINHIYLCIVLFLLTNIPISLIVNLYINWTNIMDNLDKIADGLPPFVSVAIVAYFALNKQELYRLVEYINDNFKYRSANGLTNMTMRDSCKAAKSFSYIYTACTMFSVLMYVIMPVIVHMLTKQPLQQWFYKDITSIPVFVMLFSRQLVGQVLVGLAMGQLGVLFAANSILLCGQLDLLCCSLRNVRYTALLRGGAEHSAVAHAHADVRCDEENSYIYNSAEMTETEYHYDNKEKNRLLNKTTNFDIYSGQYDDATCIALRDCARLSQVVKVYKDMFERFVSPLLVLRVVQVTIYLCTLLYAATLKFDMITVEYLAAVALDIFVYCYYGNQIILQAARVSTAAYQSAWHTIGVRPRVLLINLLLANKRPVVVRAGGFLPMDLHTFVVIIKTSFSYYTLLVNVNEKQ